MMNRLTPAERRGQGGYMLITVLGLLALCGMIIGALLTVTINSMATMSSQKLSARQSRAADSALETAINQIRTDPTGNLASSSACDPGVSSLALDSVNVSVTCINVPGDPAAPQVPATSAASTNSLKVVGSTYNGSVAWKTDCAAGAPGPGCFPWKSAIGTPNYTAYGTTLNSYGATFVHSGANPLRVSGGVWVKGAAAVLRNPVSGGPGLEAGGEYTQGAAGAFSAQGGGACGLLGFTHPWNVAAARVNDLTNGPECSNGTAAALSVLNGLDAPAKQFAATPKANAWMPTAAAPTPVSGVAQTVPACSGNVIALNPGSYNAAQTAVLNGYWASAADGCDNKTFWFRPGDYWFDSGNGDNSITIADGSAKIIFGEPTNAAVKTGTAAAVTDFPQACDNTKAGVSITLSPRTTVRHSAGRVAVCDTTTGTTISGTPPSIWQTAWTDGGWSGFANSITNFTGRSAPWYAGYSNYAGSNAPGARRPNDGSVGSWSVSCSFLQFCDGDLYVTATELGALTAAGGAGADPGSAPIDWAQVVLTGNSQNSNDMESWLQAPAYTELTMYLRNPATGVVSSTASCGGRYQSINETPDAQTTVAFDLLRDPQSNISGLPSCRSLITDRGQLYNARVDLRMHVNSKCNSCNYGITLDGIGVRTGLRIKPGSAPTGDFSNPAGVQTYGDGSYALYSEECSFWVWDGCPTGTRSITMPALGNAEVPPLNAGAITSAQVEVRAAESNDGLWGLTLDAYPEIWDHSYLQFILTNLPGGASCAVQYSRTPTWNQSLTYDMLNSTATTVAGYSRCSSVLTDARQLYGATLTTKLHLERDGWAISDDFGLLIDYIGLTTTSGSWLGPTSTNVLTSNATASGNGDSFNSFGSVSLPVNTTDVKWNGPATASPLVTGDLVVGALGSEGTGDMGSLCCGPSRSSERRVLLKATVNGRLRASAIVRISDQLGGVFSPGQAVVVEDWQLCNSDSTATKCTY